jgi:hypothetical protein
VRGLTQQARAALLLSSFVVAAVVVLSFGPIPQDPAYHVFADLWTCLGIPNFGNVISNLPFSLIGIAGLWVVLGPKAAAIFDHRSDRVPYIVLFMGMVLVGPGSAYYHGSPDNWGLLWDRLPMTVAFMSLTAAFVADRIDRRIGLAWVLPILLVLGVASAVYWYWTETLGRGDLRFYGLVQFYPMLAMALICLLYPRRRYTDGGALVWLLALYGAAKILESFDAQVYDLLGRAISGHSLKHIVASVAGIVVIQMLLAAQRSERAQASGS